MKVALITGASKGIGERVAEGLAADGYSLALVARSADKLDALSRRIRSAPYGKNLKVATYPLDVQDATAVVKAVSSIVSEFSQIDLLFNNAGIARLGTTDIPIAQFDELLAVNLKGAFSFLQAVVPIMKRQKSGMIINMSSIAGKTGFEGWGAYAASKFGLLGLNESLYRELSPLGIKVTALCPSWVDTEMAEPSDLSSEEMIQTDDILMTIRWLLSLSPAAVVKEVILGCRSEAV